MEKGKAMKLNELVRLTRATETLDALIDDAELNGKDHVLVNTSMLRFLVDFILEANCGIALQSMIDNKWEKDVLAKSVQILVDDVLREGEDDETRVTPINRTEIIEWIPVEERLPENSRIVLVTIRWAPEDVEVTTILYFTVCGSWGNFTDKVIAWAELPHPYKRRNDNE